MKRTGIPASITLAQGILESNNGNSTLALKANNHFGIKCHNDWNGKTYHHDDDRPNECFRKYKNADESFYDHSAFLIKHSRYAFLFEYEITDYKSWAKGLKKAGYATHSKYDKLLIKIIEANQLYQFDNKKFKLPKEDRPKVVAPNLLAEDVDDYAIDPFGTKVKSTNRIDYVISEEGDTYESIAEINDLMSWQLYKYNEKTRGAGLEAGEIVYLQPKRRKADVKFKYHIFKEGDTMYNISQKYGIKLKRLFKLNNMELGDEPTVGQQLSLRKRIKRK
ncbi:MAG: glucosaminidase domain-containing protein [Salinivirgaceae bacterium]|nr:glucosaminidase domain-containing protein [Salinivirgaceae bacterium]